MFYFVSALRRAAGVGWPFACVIGSIWPEPSIVGSFVVDGSFVTAKPVPGDLDAVILVSDTFGKNGQRESEAAMDLEEIVTTRQDGDLFAAADDAEFSEWVAFSRMDAIKASWRSCYGQPHGRIPKSM